MAALSVSASLLKCSVAQKNINASTMPIKLGQVKNPSLQLQRRSFKIHAITKEKESEEEFDVRDIGVSLSEGIDKAMLNKYGKEEFAEKARLEYDKAIEILSLGGFLDEALELKKCMEMKGIPLSTHTYFHLIFGLCAVKKLNEAMKLFEESKGRPGCEPNEFTYAPIIERLWLKKKDEGAVMLVRNMLKQGLVPLDLTVFGLVEELCKHKCFAMATELVHEILPPKLVYYNCLIENMGKTEEAGLAKNTLTLMQQRGVDPNYYSYSSVVMSCGSKGLLDDAARVAIEMTEKGFDEVPRPPPPPGKAPPNPIELEDEDQEDADI